MSSVAQSAVSVAGKSPLSLVPRREGASVEDGLVELGERVGWRGEGLQVLRIALEILCGQHGQGGEEGRQGTVRPEGMQDLGEDEGEEEEGREQTLNCAEAKRAAREGNDVSPSRKWSLATEMSSLWGRPLWKASSTREDGRDPTRIRQRPGGGEKEGGRGRRGTFFARLDEARGGSGPVHERHEAQAPERRNLEGEEEREEEEEGRPWGV